MRSKIRWFNDYWQGVLLGLAAIVASLWLGMEGKLDLYIHPRYIIFTMVIGGLSLLVILLGLLRGLHDKKELLLRPASTAALGTVCLVLAACLLVTKPSALTSATASQRGVNSAALDLSTQSTTTNVGVNTDYSRFSVKEWASLLSQTNDVSFFAQKKVDITGFVSPVKGNPNEFYVSRFVITCCAVDARAIGVPVYSPNWQTSYQADQWVQVSGIFIKNPDQGGSVVVKPSSITKTSQPGDPYAY